MNIKNDKSKLNLYKNVVVQMIDILLYNNSYITYGTFQIQNKTCIFMKRKNALHKIVLKIFCF